MKMQWRLRVVMAERGISTATELHRRLEAVGVSISSAQLSRVMKEMPARISSDLLWGLMKVLECGPEDLIHVERDGEPAPRPERKPAARQSSAPATPRKKPRKEKEPQASPAGITGPRAIPFPVTLDANRDQDKDKE